MTVEQKWFYCEDCKDGGKTDLLANERCPNCGSSNIIVYPKK